MSQLTDRQQQVLRFISETSASTGYPPTVREIAGEPQLSSPSTVHVHLANLERLGLIRRDPSKPRALELVDAPRPPRPLPLVGQVAAGVPLLAEQNIEELRRGAQRSCVVPTTTSCCASSGDSMIEAGIYNDDLIVVHPLPRPTTARHRRRVAVVGDDEATPSVSSARAADPPAARERPLRADRRHADSSISSAGSWGCFASYEYRALATVAQPTSRRASTGRAPGALAGREEPCLWCGPPVRGRLRHLVASGGETSPSAARSAAAELSGMRSAADPRRCRGERRAGGAAAPVASPGVRRARHAAPRGLSGAPPRRRRLLSPQWPAWRGFAVFLLLIFVAVIGRVCAWPTPARTASIDTGARVHGARGDTIWDHRREPVRRRRTDLREAVWRSAKQRSGRRCVVPSAWACGLTLPYLGRVASTLERSTRSRPAGSSLAVYLRRAGTWRSLVAHLLWEQGVGEFKSARPDQSGSASGSSSVGRASAFQAEGRGFETRLPLHLHFCRSGAARRAPVAQLDRAGDF